MTARWGGCAQHAPLLSLSNPLSLCFAVSPFDTLVAAIDNPRVKGTDSALTPLSQAHLKRLIADTDLMTEFVQHKFTMCGSVAKLGYDEAKELALRAVAQLHEGALLLQPYTLGRACRMMSVSRPR